MGLGGRTRRVWAKGGGGGEAHLSPRRPGQARGREYTVGTRVGATVGGGGNLSPRRPGQARRRGAERCTRTRRAPAGPSRPRPQPTPPGALRLVSFAQRHFSLDAKFTLGESKKVESRKERVMMDAANERKTRKASERSAPAKSVAAEPSTSTSTMAHARQTSSDMSHAAQKTKSRTPARRGE